MKDHSVCRPTTASIACRAAPVQLPYTKGINNKCAVFRARRPSSISQNWGPDPYGVRGSTATGSGARVTSNKLWRSKKKARRHGVGEKSVHQFQHQNQTPTPRMTHTVHHRGHKLRSNASNSSLWSVNSSSTTASRRKHKQESLANLPSLEHNPMGYVLRTWKTSEAHHVYKREHELGVLPQMNCYHKL